MEEQQKKRIFSGIQPSGNLTIGNYMGALRNWVKLQDDYDCLYCVVNQHAITVRQDPPVLRRRSLETMAVLLACGVDPNKSILFIQSHVPQHTMLSWVLCCSTYMGELNRMTQFKDKSQKHSDNINGGLFTYPVLMAADILLYQANLVPVGSDQKQHVELARDVCIRFNNLYGDTFVVPEPYIPKVGARIMSLQEPDKKMSKSDPNPNAFVSILDEPDVITRKIKRAVTDCEGVIAFDSVNRAGVSNLLSILSACTDRGVEELANELSGKGYGVLKSTVTEALIATLQPIQSEYKRLIGDRAYLSSIIEQGAAKAESLAKRTISKVYRKVGFDTK